MNERRIALRRPLALLLDLDDTILDNGAIPENIRRTCELISADYPQFDASHLFETDMKCWAKYWPEVEIECWLGGLTAETVSHEAWRRTFVECGSDDPVVIDRAFQISQKLDREGRRAFPDVENLLGCTRELSVQIGLVSNGPSGLQRDRLRSLGLSDTFDAVIISAEVGVAKPDPEIFGVALRQLGVDASDAWHVGDNLSLDVGGASAAGLTAVWLNRSRHSRGADDPMPELEIESLQDLVSVLEALPNALRGSI